MTREKIIEIARAEVGTTENPSNTNKTMYGEWYEMNGVAWCAIFVSWVFDKAGLPLGTIQTKKGYHHCQSAHNYFKREGGLTKNPKKGDIVMFDWQGDGWADHTGIFVEWTDNDKNEFISLEGNTSRSDNSNGGMVMERSRRRESVKSFVSPDVYSDITSEDQNYLLKNGDRGSEVVEVQILLDDLGYETLADGWYGEKTAANVRAFQKDNLMVDSGEVDMITLGALQEEARKRIAVSKMVTGTYLRFGDSGFAVTELQKALNRKGSKLMVDGQFGRNTAKALREFQENKGLVMDGIAGPETFKELGI